MSHDMGAVAADVNNRDPKSTNDSRVCKETLKMTRHILDGVLYIGWQPIGVLTLTVDDDTQLM